MIRALAFLACLPSALWAQEFPALFNVTGVASNDVLNIRAAPGAGSEIIGALRPDATGVEVIRASENGRWGLVNIFEQSGWVSLRFLAETPEAPSWWEMVRPLNCFGTEPFWNVELTSRAMTLFRRPEGQFPMTPIWESGGFGQPATVVLRHTIPQGENISHITAQACDDGMSDRDYGLKIHMFLDRDTGSSTVLRGCCSLVLN